MIELLNMCGFEEQELEAELPRIERVFNRLGITAEDIERGKQRLTKYYDIELKGVRKILRLCIQELANSVMAREDGKTKIVYGFMAPVFITFSSVLVSSSKDVYATHLCNFFQLVLGSIFGKMVPILEAAEQRWLKAGKVAHCGNVKTLVGLFALDLIPKPDLLVTSGSLCDTAPKSIELLHELYDIPICHLEICQDRDLREYPAATKRTLDFAAKSMRRCTERVQEVVGFEITNGMLREVMDARRELGHAMRKLRNLIDNSDSLLLSANHQSLWTHLNFLPLTRDSLSDAIDAVNVLCEELQERSDKGLGIMGKGAPKIVTILPSHYTDPYLDYLAGELGIAIVSTGTGSSASDVGEPEDPYEMISLMDVQGSLHNSTARRIADFIEGCKRSNVDGVLDQLHIGCRTVAGDALIIKNAITKELGIPALLVERDDFDPRVCNHDQYRRNLETFKAMLTSSK